MHIKFKLKKLLCACVTFSLLQPAFSAEICPRRDAAFPLSVTVFDGTPEELASLVPEESGKRSGYWLLESVYDQKRSVTVLCKYVDGHVERVDLKQRVSKCNYQINKKNQFSIQCK
ncbi:STY0301 family protein [Undibacterium sp. TC9W]|uniref:STY0301 family protein n=1 Tax=Undibacterium sp. TC9W TaxID=3413053 RepID=UPI003BEF62D1